MSIKKPDFKFINLGLSLTIAALSAWRLLALIGWYPQNTAFWWGWWLGLTLLLSFLWYAALLIGQSYSPRLTGQQRITALIGVLIFGLTGWLLTKSAGLSTLTLELYAANVWSPEAFQVIWTGDGLGRTPFKLPTSDPMPTSLEIIATGKANAASQGRDVFLLNALWSNGQPLSLENFSAASGWQFKAITWGNYENRPAWITQDNFPANLAWEGTANGPLTLIFAKNPLSGEVAIRWNDQSIRTLDLYTPQIGLQSITLPLRDDVVWRATLPLNVLTNEVGITSQPDPLNNYPATLQKIRLMGLPGGPWEVSGHHLAEALHAEKGWLELVEGGVQLKANERYSPPELFLTDRLAAGSAWSLWLPRLENGLMMFYLATIGALLFAAVARRLQPHLLTNLNLLAITLFVTLLGGELFFRVYLPPTDRYYIWEPNLHFVFNPDSTYTPGIEGETNVVTNAQGFRGDDLTSASDYNILAMGGSTTEALYLDQAESWPYLLQEELNDPANEKVVWVGNAGRSGRNTREHVLQAQRLLPQYPQLDALILLTGINDLGLRLEQAEAYDPHYLNSPGATQTLLRRAFDVFPQDDPTTTPRYRRTGLWQALAKIRQAQADDGATTPTTIEVQDDDGSFLVKRRAQRQQAEIRDQLPDLTTALEEYRRNLNQIIDLAKAQNMRVILATQPTMWRSDLTPAEQALLWFGWGPNFDYFYSVEALRQGIDAYNAVLLDVCRQRQVECIDLAAALPQDTTVFYDDVHFNESGAQQVSRVIAAYLLEQPPFVE